jgi:hypothetical protein
MAAKTRGSVDFSFGFGPVRDKCEISEMAGLRTILGLAVAAGALTVLAHEVVTVEPEALNSATEQRFAAEVAADDAHSARRGEARRGEARRGEARRRDARRGEEDARDGDGIPQRVAVAVRSHAGEDELTMRWADLSAEARVRELRQQYRAAMDGMGRGEGWNAHRAHADAALSALRAELYATPSGRKEHERLEKRYQAAVDRERARSASEGGGR